MISSKRGQSLNVVRVAVLGQGRIGAHLSQVLHNQGHFVTSWGREQARLPWTSHAFIDSESLSLTDYDAVVVASGSASPATISYAQEFERTLGILQKGKVKPGARIFFLSSGAVYGDCKVPKSERDAKLPCTPYGLVKSRLEDELRNYYGKDVTTLRIGNLIPRKNDLGIFKMFSESFASRVKIQFRGSRTDVRDYAVESDVIEVIAQLITTKADFQLLNIGSGVSISLGEIESLILRLDPSITVSWTERIPFDVPSTRLDCSKLVSTGILTLTRSKEVLLNQIENLVRLRK